ncbi:MAG: L,D-transpeptidase [Gammaproteobacteria bacterium]|nr:L,D-transpeptidase [Gammaproteobacteria bacterium]
MRTVVLLLCVLVTAPLSAGKRAWVLVETATSTLTVMRGDRPVKKFRNISVGKGGVSLLRLKGDDTTPLGEFHIARVKNRSMYHRFYEFDFPTLEHAEAAFKTGLIDLGTYRDISTAVQRKSLPPQNTALGGHLGIHGIGSGNRRVHDQFNWTNGCIALTNEQIDALRPWLQIGTKVVVR